MSFYCGWDIGGVHLKLSRLESGETQRTGIVTSIEPFEIWKAPAMLTERLTTMLARAAAAAAGNRRGDGVRHAVTMTAELSDLFASRSEGVRYILQACLVAFGGDAFRVFTLDGELVRPADAMERPLQVAAANWAATAHLIARHAGPSILIDMGSTTTDIIPIDARGPITISRSDTERLLAGELVYTGVLRTPPASLAESVPLRGGTCRIASEHFCLMADAYRLLGRIVEGDYTVVTTDGRGKSREDAAARLARLVCADRRDLADAEITAIAEFLEERQIDLIARALRQVRQRFPGVRARPIWTAGIGSFIAREAAARVGEDARPLGQMIPNLVEDGWERAAPSAALALLLAAEHGDADGIKG